MFFILPKFSPSKFQRRKALRNRFPNYFFNLVFRVREQGARISPEFFNLAKKNNISFTEAIRVGLSVLFAEMEIPETENYINNLSISRNIKKYQQEIIELNKKLAELEIKRDLKELDKLRTTQQMEVKND